MTLPELLSRYEISVNKAAKLLHELMSNGSSSIQLARQIKEEEHAADQVVHAVNMQLSTTFIHPIDGEDILALTKTLDDVIDCIHHSAEAYVRIYNLSTTTPSAQHETCQKSPKSVSRFIVLRTKGTSCIARPCARSLISSKIKKSTRRSI